MITDMGNRTIQWRKNNAFKNNAGTTRFLCPKNKKLNVSLYITLKNNKSNGKKKKHKS